MLLDEATTLLGGCVGFNFKQAFGISVSKD
jgi:hypothetical protein